MNIIPWNRKSTPLDRSIGLSDVSGLITNVLRRIPTRGGSSQDDLWQPAVDITDDQGQLTVTAEVPGVARSDIRIEVNGTRMTLRGEKRPSRSNGEDWWLRETASGSFVRQLSLPTEVDAERTHAKLEDGILTVSLPIAATSKTKAIKVG